FERIKSFLPSFWGGKSADQTTTEGATDTGVAAGTKTETTEKPKISKGMIVGIIICCVSLMVISAAITCLCIFAAPFAGIITLGVGFILLIIGLCVFRVSWDMNQPKSEKLKKDEEKKAAEAEEEKNRNKDIDGQSITGQEKLVRTRTDSSEEESDSSTPSVSNVIDANNKGANEEMNEEKKDGV
ncbi:MAG: hypothetical protein LBT98_01585, partial [Puniceicoccales bacterium]|nr:hypothetical protein [Puniceicoccales bacterium]